MADKFTVTGEQHFGITGQMLEIQRQIRVKSGSPMDPELVISALQNIIEGKFAQQTKQEDNLLKLISGDHKVLVNACDGKGTLAQGAIIFEGHIDPDFEKWGLDKRGLATPQAEVQVYEMVQDAMFVHMFTSLSGDLNNLCLTQHQIRSFCRLYRDWLCPNEPTFFLFMEDGEFFVACVTQFSSGSFVDAYRFGHDQIWEASRLCRVVVPKMAD